MCFAHRYVSHLAGAWPSSSEERSHDTEGQGAKKGATSAAVAASPGDLAAPGGPETPEVKVAKKGSQSAMVAASPRNLAAPVQPGTPSILAPPVQPGTPSIFDQIQAESQQAASPQATLQDSPASQQAASPQATWQDSPSSSQASASLSSAPRLAAPPLQKPKTIKLEKEEEEQEEEDEEESAELEIDAAALLRTRMERKRKWAEYMRTLESAGQRGARKEKCPEDIKQKMLKLSDKQSYFELWCEKGTWAKVKVFEEHHKLESTTSDHMKNWLTEGQLMDLYKDEEIVNELVKSKKADAKTWRCHPELPHVMKAMQYHCIISDSQKQTFEENMKKGMRLDAEIDASEAGVLLANQQVSRTAMAIGHNAPSNDVDKVQANRDEEEKKLGLPK